MASLSCKHLLLVAFILLCVISISITGTQGRSLGVVGNSGHEKSHDDVLFKQKEEDDEVVPDHESSDLLAMDYTPASKKPPIHN